ncbi:MAG: adenine phosphoribosyltransferase [Propionicimonas sp.]|uniref:adenine phosphoribosyltransferase n=1 Tax=Propionicimonas sp. TaxID=1955623 RepID=UPI002B1E9D82|nr:adenine phosphoribosyltransferase [Propionicimonas sp.]MEA4943099.1 adenine phosphoribosyltransferase [Propionicimonas sp.]MEA5055207.1 adenine phosphoribosyltransferase [Propionicimonas sp.]MEA5119219.1 adenine phosphoribosyltransferase [Propionicimonas sp.]
MNPNQTLISSLIRDVADFPKPGVVFKDITPLLADAAGYRAAIDELAASAPPGIDVVVGMEARGFIFAGPVALALGAGFVPVRKPGKLPGDVYTESFALEYGEAALSVHTDAVLPGARVLVIDDVLATGGTIGATARLIQKLGAELVQVSVLMELSFLGGRQHLANLGITDTAAVLTV